MVLAAIGVAAVGTVASLTVRELGHSAEQSTSLQLGLREYEEALLSRSAIDTDILRAAAGSDAGALAATERAADVRGHLERARLHFEQADAPAMLFARFDATAHSLERYTATAAVLATELAPPLPAIAPGSLLLIASRLGDQQVLLSDEFRKATDASRQRTQQSVRDAHLRTIITSAAGVMTLLILTIRVDRRVRENLASTLAAETASASATAQLVEQVSRQRFAEDLREALDGAHDEDSIYEVVGRAMDLVDSAGVSELLLADSSRAHLQRVASTSNGRGCDVASPWECPAVRRGTALVFDSSESLRACPHLRNRPEGPISATCVPLLFNGRGIGVLHSVGAEDGRKPPLAIAQLSSIAAEAATGVGTIRVLKDNEFQARTDGLTGMLNRRSLEHQLRALVDAGGRFTIAMVDLDRFKQLNDTYGHEGGDRALRVFSSAAHETLRAGDPIGRYGGEEFMFVFPEQSKGEALMAIERLRSALAIATASGACPPFTASFGVAEWHPGMTVDEILRVADLRLLQAKLRGRNLVVDCDDEPVDAALATAGTT